MYLLDTNILLELRKGSRGNPAVSLWYRTAVLPGDCGFVSVVTLGEIRKGIEMISKRDSVSAQRLESWLVRLRSDYRDHILPVTEAVADEWGRMNAIRPVGNLDTLLLATAKVHGLAFATRNVRDTVGFDVPVVDPFASPV